MSTPNNQNPFDVQGLLGRKIAEAAGQELINGLIGGGAKRGLDAGLNMAKDIKLGDIFSTVEKVVNDVNSARENAATTAREAADSAREAAAAARTAAEAARAQKVRLDDDAVFIPFTKSEDATETRTPAPKAEEKASEPVSVPVSVAKEESAPAHVKAKPVPTVDANENIDRIHDIATSKLTPEEHDLLVTSVMNLVQIASPEGFTGEHVRWLSRLYGNKNI
jgi:hypothetical protein